MSLTSFSNPIDANTNLASSALHFHQKLDDAAIGILLNLFHIKQRDAVGKDAVALLHGSQFAQRLGWILGHSNAHLRKETLVELAQRFLAKLVVVPRITKVLLIYILLRSYIAHIVNKLDESALGMPPLISLRLLLQHPLVVFEHQVVRTGLQLVIFFSCHRRIILKNKIVNYKLSIINSQL